MKTNSIRKMNKTTKHNLITGYAFLLPNLLGFVMFTLVPVIMVFVLAMTDWNAFGSPHFVWFKNFINLFSDMNFQAAFKNNLIYSLLFVPGTIVLALVFAIMINKKILGKSVFRVIYFLPHITAMFAVATVWRMLYNGESGPINVFLRSIGIMNPPNWLANPHTALFAIIVMAIWKSYGYYMVIFIAGLTNVPKSLYEAADLDGANSWQKFCHVTWPQLSPVTFFITITCIISSFKVFDAINVMTAGGPGRATYVLVYSIYTEAFTNFQFGYACSISIVLFAMILAVTLFQWRSQKNWVAYN